MTLDATAQYGLIIYGWNSWKAIINYSTKFKRSSEFHPYHTRSVSWHNLRDAILDAGRKTFSKQKTGCWCTPPTYLEVNRSILSVIPSGHPIAQKMFRTDHLRGITFSRRWQNPFVLSSRILGNVGSKWHFYWFLISWNKNCKRKFSNNLITLVIKRIWPHIPRYIKARANVCKQKQFSPHRFRPRASQRS